MKPTISAIVALAAGLAPTFGVSDDRPGYLPRDVRAALLPGLRVQFQPVGQRLFDVRRDRLAATFVKAGTSPTPFLPPGRFLVQYDGYLRLRLRGDFDFEVVGDGTTVLKLNGETVIDTSAGKSKATGVALLKGYNTIDLLYESPEDPSRNSFFRVYWSSEEFPREPLPVDRLWCDGRDETLQRGLRLREGRELFANKLCVRCHQPEVDPAAPGFVGLPELAHDAPSLATAAHRLEPAWVARWIADPPSLRNDVSMPSVLHGLSDEDSTTAAADLAAYVATLKLGQPATPVEASEERLEQGTLLYESRGCIACHRVNPPTEEDEAEADRVSLHFVAAKFRPGALAEFLQDSRAHYRWSRMPKFEFDAEEAASLEVFLRDRAKGELDAVAAGDPDLGGERFKKLGCIQCHAENKLPPAAPHRAAIDFDRLDAGCLAEEPTKLAPDFRLTEEQRSAVVAFLSHASRETSLAKRDPAEFAERTIRAVNCTACHSRDDEDGALPLLAADEGELGLLPDPIPGITWVGEKLYPAWSRELFAGKLDYRLRDHFRARMPAFPARGDGLATGLSMQHGFNPVTKPTFDYDADLAGAGSAVAAPQIGLSCIRCHPIGEQPPTAPEQARSTNLAFTRRRMRHEFYTRWMLFPQRVEPNTRMIRFAPDGRRTGLSDVYDGDARRQFEAVWNWLGELHAEERERVDDD